MEKPRTSSHLNVWRLQVLLFITSHVSGFNLHTENPKIFRSRDENSTFGHRVCHFGESSVLVTDPLYSHGTGGVYRCEYSKKECIHLPLQSTLKAEVGLSLACNKHRAVVCGPRLQHNCEGFNYLNGVCVEFSDSLTHSLTYKPVFQECHVIPPLDVVILFDDSKSIKPKDFIKMVNFIKTIVHNFSNSRAQVAVAKFSTKVSAVFNFENFVANRNAENLMRGVTQSEGETHTPSAIRFVLDNMFQLEVGMRNNSQKLLIVITDGKSNELTTFDSVLALADKRKVKRFAIGVGNEYSREELIEISTNPHFVFESPTFSSLSSILPQLTDRIFNIEGMNVGNSSSIQHELSQGGFSVALDKEVSVFGAVGSFSWSGGLEEKIPGLNSSFISALNVEGIADSYLGYSVAVVTTVGGGVYFAGAPRHKHTGSVFGFTRQTDTQHWNITHTAHGSQLGSYFGAELCVLYGNGVAFLAIAAPMFDSERVGGEVRICPVESATLNCSVVLRGMMGNTGGRFGSALAALQDLNGDSVMDLAVGAPQEEWGKGAIYIFTSYLGSFRTQYTQRVGGAALNSRLQYFGLSLHCAGDLSSDGLPDLLVGSKGAATVLRTQPVMCASVSVTLDPPIITQKFFHCSAPYGLNTPIANATVCISLKEVSMGTIQGPLQASVYLNMELDSGLLPRRLVFSPMSSVLQWNSTVTSSTSLCHTHPISIPSCISDYREVPLSVKLSMRGKTLEHTLGLKPVLNPDCTHNLTHWVLLEKVCGKDHVCVSDLSVFLQISRNMVVKTVGYLVNVTVEVYNKGEDASDTELSISHPSVLFFTRVTTVEFSGHVTCASNETAVAVLTNTTCRFGLTIVRQKAKVVFILSFQVSNPLLLGDQLNVTASVKSKNEKPETLHDNSANISVPVKDPTNILLFDGGSTHYISYNQTATIQHKYKVINDGDTSLPVSVMFVLPLETQLGLLWDVSLPAGNSVAAKCEKLVLVKNESTSLYSQHCMSSSCHLFGCSVNLLAKHLSLTFSFTGKLKAKDKVFNVQVESWGIVTFDKNRYTQYLNEEDLQHSIITLVESPAQVQTALIVSLSVTFGVLAMIVMFYVLYRVGFLKPKSQKYNVDQASGAAAAAAPSTEQADSNVQAETSGGETAASDTSNYQKLD